MRTDRSSVERFAAVFEHDTHHSQHVTRVAEELFDCSGNIHGFGKPEREILVFAALLHDIGWSEGGRKHHKRACELILKSGIEGLDARQLLMVANVARYHRKGLPKLSHEEFASLDPPDREIVRSLSAILRIADGLDASHSGLAVIKGCRVVGKSAVIDLSPSDEMAVEIESAKEKSDLFEEVFGLKVEFG